MLRNKEKTNMYPHGKLRLNAHSFIQQLLFVRGVTLTSTCMQVVPSTFADAMRYIEAMRRQQRGLALAAEREQSKVEGGAPRLKFFSPSHPIDASAAL